MEERRRAADARRPDRVARQARRHGLPAHRSAQDRLRRGDRDDVVGLRHALPHPAGGGQRQGSGDRHRRALRARLGARARAHHASANQARDRQPARHRALPGRVLQPREVDQGRRARTPARIAACPTSSSWSSSARATSSSTPTTSTSCSIVDWLWQYAFEQRASDIHLEPRREQGIVRFRIDGVLHQVYQMPARVLAAMTSRIKILGRMDVVEKRRPQDGRIKTRTRTASEIELRLSTLPTAFGEKLVMRIFDPEVLVKRLHASSASPTTTSARWNEHDRRARTASSWSPGRPARARPPRSTRR